MTKELARGIYSEIEPIYVRGICIGWTVYIGCPALSSLRHGREFATYDAAGAFQAGELTDHAHMLAARHFDAITAWNAAHAT